MYPRFTYLGNGATLQIQTPNSDDGQGFYFYGTSAATEPVVTVGKAGGISSPSPSAFSFYNVSEFGTAAQPLYGEINIAPYGGNLVSIDHGILLSHGNLAFNSGTGDKMALGGTSVVTNGSHLTVWGGRYVADPLSLNGSLIVSNNSTADLHGTPVQGHGTIDVEQGSTVDVNNVVAGIHADVARGGLLYLYSYSADADNFQGTVHEAAGATVDLGSAGTAVSEVFHTATGTLDLLNSAGTQVAALRFTGNSALYAAADGHGGMDITTAHSVGSLPTIFTN